MEKSELLKKILSISNINDGIINNIKYAIDYIEEDPQSSLTKCRIVLERILSSIYISIRHIPPKQNMIGILLNDKEVKERIPSKVFARMNYIREIANHATHSGDVDVSDSSRIVEDIISIAEWFSTNQILHATNNDTLEKAQEILPQLKIKFPNYLRQNIISVRFIQNSERCYLEETTKEIVAGYLEDQRITKVDLGFITSGDDEKDLLFSPEKTISNNVKKILEEFDEISIINCTNLFTDEASNEVYKNSLSSEK